MYVSCECAGPVGRSARTFNQSMLFSIDLVALSQLEKQTVPRGGGPGDVAARYTSPHCTECLFCWRSRWNWKEEPSLWTVAAGTVWKSLSTTFLLWLVNLWTPDAYEHLQINPESKEFFFICFIIEILCFLTSFGILVFLSSWDHGKHRSWHRHISADTWPLAHGRQD